VSCYQENGDSIPGLAVSGAEKIYKKLKNRELDITHSFYLKEFQLVTPPINFDYVMLDEAQDSNDVTLDMFFKLQGRKIIVGDTHQQIYAFRGSVDAIQNIHADISLSLTKTFRCRPAIVSAANFILSYYKKESQPIESVNKNVEKPITQAYITRTNAALIGFVAEFDEFSLTRKADEIFKSSLSVYYFIIKTHHLINPEFKFLTKFSGVSELQKYIEDTNDIELKMALTMATDYGSKLVQLLEKAKQNQYTKSKLTLTTAHSSKGLEFDSTILWDDFPSLMAVRDDEKLTDVEKDNEYNLLYVAVTRARYSIENLTVNSFTVSAVS
jgi:superfamily I DNA/RNA helicase